MCEINDNNFKLRLRETLQTRELAAQNDFHFSELSQDQINALAESIKSIVSALSDFVNHAMSILKKSFFPFLESLTEQEAALTWAAVYHPRLYHCAKYSKCLRIRVKNITRIVKLYRKQKEEKQWEL